VQDDRYDEAVGWSKSAYQSAGELGAEDIVQNAIGNLGWAYFKLGESDKALELLLEARRRASALGDTEDEIKWLTTSGYIFMTTNRSDDAKHSYSAALQAARRTNSREDMSNILIDLAEVSVISGAAAEADFYVAQAFFMAAESGSRPDVMDAEAIQMQAAALRNDQPRAEKLLHEVEVAPESQTAMKWACEHAMARLYEREGHTQQSQAMYNAALTTFETARAQLQHEDSQLPFVANATSIYDDYIHFLVAQGKSEEALRIADQSRARTLAQGLGVDLNKRYHPAALHPGAIARKANATLLFYWLGEKQSYLWTITPTRTNLTTLAGRDKILPVVENYRKSLLGPGDPLQATSQPGSQLYDLLVAPAAKFIDRKRPVMILADGPLSLLNFETLIVPAPAPHYWIEDATLIAAPSLATLASAMPSRSNAGKLLLLGDAISAGSEYPELPQASLEMKQIEKHFGARDQFVYAGQQATPTTYLTSDPKQYSYIHFVAHGVASRTDPLDSAIILSRTSQSADGYKLYAREIMRHPIDARLVTISACNGSGTRAYAGEGLVGLSWAFLRAGAHNTIGALWEVSDDSTPRLMDDLYQGLEDGLSPAEALRKAKLGLLHSTSVFRKPYYWAPFQIYTRL
jgi:CHAT domain-containing protein